MKLSVTNDGGLHIGDVVMLLNIGGENMECSTLSINADINSVAQMPSPSIQAPCDISAGRGIQACARTAFIITRYTKKHTNTHLCTHGNTHRCKLTMLLVWLQCWRQSGRINSGFWAELFPENNKWLCQRSKWPYTHKHTQANKHKLPKTNSQLLNSLLKSWSHT